jgi:hypothetical protein
MPALLTPTCCRRPRLRFAGLGTDTLMCCGLIRWGGYCNFSARQSARFLGIQERHNYSHFVAAALPLFGRP